ncbi:MAG TPA: fumarylacetoacetate hydrolase family protein [Rhizomicrobium sp.]|nr:fumarylacetoacetate hydrolase family protein [Rhizomicrobium sp.]
MKRATFEADGKERIGVVSGDVIFTGTPGGVGFAFRPPKFLKSGDHVRVEIDRVGAIEAKMA